MSFDVDLIDPQLRKCVSIESHEEGGTYALGGTDEATLNITYNYSLHFCKHFSKGLRYLDGKSASSTIEKLSNAVKILGVKQDKDYWASTPGNAGYALSILLGWAKQYPQGIWEVR